MEHRPCYESICDGRSGGYDDLGPELAESGKRGDELALAWLFPRWREPTPLHGDDPGERVIGRDPSCAVELSGNDVSRRHAALRREGSGARSSPTSGAATASGSTGGWSLPRRSRRVTSSGSAAGSASSRPSPARSARSRPGVWGGAALAAGARALRRAAPSDLPIVLEGETGTGKEVVARAIHAWSGRRGPFVAVNCAALPEALAEGELFGYRAGRVHRRRPGEPRLLPQRRGRARCCSTRCRTCRWRCRPSCCACSSSARCSRSARRGRCRSTSASSSRASSRCWTPSRAGRFRADLLARLDGLTVRLPPLRDAARGRRAAVLAAARAASAARAACRPSTASWSSASVCTTGRSTCASWCSWCGGCWCCTASETTLRAEHLPERIGQQAAAPARGRRAAATPARRRRRRAGAAARRRRSRSTSRRWWPRCAPRAATSRAPPRCSASPASAPTG